MTLALILLWLLFSPLTQPGQGFTGDVAQVPASSSLNTIQPFFDGLNNPVTVKFPPSQKVDMTPPPPRLNGLDRAVLNTCGEIGSPVSAKSFKELLLSNPEVLRQLQQGVGGELYAGRKTTSQFLEDLTTIWFTRGAFSHIFCGELESTTKIGGLHFVGRYLQLQAEGIGGRLPNNSQNEEVIPGVLYTVGVVIKKGDRVYRDPRKGYAYVSHAQDILLNATKAFKSQGKSQGACIYLVVDRGSNKSYNAVFVRDKNAIVTFYPDVTPNQVACHRGGGDNPVI